MKKSLFAICIAAIMLTGCGNAATSGESTADTSSKAETASSAVSDDESKDEESDSQGDETFCDLDGIDFPIPSGMEKVSKAEGKGKRTWSGNANDATVYYAIDVRINDEYQNEENGYTVADLPNIMLSRIDDHLYLTLGSNTDGDAERKTVESQTEEEFMGVPALCEKGFITTYEDVKVNYIAHYAYLDFSEGNEMHTPTCWFVFTTSDDKDAIDLMNKAADLPLTKAKLHE